jgi:hypothetical protein
MKHRFSAENIRNNQLCCPAREGMATSFAGPVGKSNFTTQVSARTADMELWKTGGWRP